jgi:formylglycine-generating enzyme required for sulfatase activity
MVPHFLFSDNMVLQRDREALVWGHAAPRVLRGGCWETGPMSVRSANRGGIIPGRATSRFGFRVVVEK